MENTDAFVRLAGRAINAKVRESYSTSIFTAALVLIGSREVCFLHGINSSPPATT